MWVTGVEGYGVAVFFGEKNSNPIPLMRGERFGFTTVLKIGRILPGYNGSRSLTAGALLAEKKTGLER